MPKTDVRVKLTKMDGNAFAIMGRVQKALKRDGRSDLAERFAKEAQSGDYDHMLRVCMKYVIVE